MKTFLTPMSTTGHLFSWQLKYKLNVDFVFHRIENIVRKEENDHFQHFLLLAQYCLLFQTHIHSPKNPLVRSYLQVQNGQGRVIFLTRSSGRTSDIQKSDSMKYSIFLLDGESGKLQIFTRANQILPYQNYDNVKQQQVINFSFQDSFYSSDGFQPIFLYWPYKILSGDGILMICNLDFG